MNTLPITEFQNEQMSDEQIAQTNQRMEFGYYNIKGLGEPVRWVFLHFGLPVEEWNPASDDEWTSKAKSLNDHTLFPALPYLKDGSTVITQPSAIQHYLIEKAGRSDFLGKSEVDRAFVRQVDAMLAEIRAACLGLINSSPNTDHKAEVQRLFGAGSDFEHRIDALHKHLGDKDWITGYMTLADFMLTFTARFTGAICYSTIGMSPWAKHRNIVNHLDRVSNLPGIQQRLTRAVGAPYWPADKTPFRLLNFKEMIDEGINPI